MSWKNTLNLRISDLSHSSFGGCVFRTIDFVAELMYNILLVQSQYYTIEYIFH